MDISIHGLRVEPDNFVEDPEHIKNISIHGLRVEPDCAKCANSESSVISIHGLRVEPDVLGAFPFKVCVYFNPRAPCGARLYSLLYPEFEEYFNPRAPCGARPEKSADGDSEFLFQSTGSVWSPTTS